ncbi:MAG: SDR family oxidoreductase [Rhodopirellula sp.]|nr:SDR family oxidoreductase [Rhodopirellula sp.]
MSRSTTECAPLAGQIAVVSGSSSGIGRAIALELAGAGADVVIHARESRQRAEAAAGAVRDLGRQSLVILCNLAEAAEQDRLVDEAWNWRGRVDIWVNNAGVDLLTGNAARWSIEQKLEALWNVDVLATVRISRDVGAKMKARGRGVLLNMGWDGAERGMRGDSGQLFAAAKGAVMAFSRSLAQSLAPEVRVNCLAPGWIRTAWGEQASEIWQQRARRESLLGRWGTAEDVARVARFLASADAGFLTGQTIEINGGFNHE